MTPPLATARNPYPTAAYYPQQPLLLQESSYATLPPDTLFFIFYYQQGTIQQYYAAQALSKTWKYHKKYHTWFRRLEPPRVVQDDFEQGSYKFFDYEGAWIQRQLPDFQLQYADLEDWSS